MRISWSYRQPWVGVCLAILAWAYLSQAATVITNTRPEVAQMAALWEADSIQISPLANAQYPEFTNDWQFIFPHTTISGDGDIHIDMAVDAMGTGANANSISNSPIIAEVVNATSAQLSNLRAQTGARAKTRGIFRFYTEHANERHFELHPVTELLTWNGSAFVLNADYRPNVGFVADGAAKTSSTLSNLFNGSQTVTATVLGDNNRIAFTYFSPSANYVQYDGVTVSRLTNDFVSQYFLFRPNLVTQTVVRCRIVTNTIAAAIASTLVSNQTVTVNALTRTDMLVVSNRIASLTVGQTSTFARPLEFITLSVTNQFASPPPVISNVHSTNLTESSAVIVWNTDQLSDSLVDYGLSSSGVTNSLIVSALVTSHSVMLTDLQNDTIYYYDVSSTSSAGTTTDDNEEQHYTFTTLPALDLDVTPPGGFVSSGDVGGPFTPLSQTYTLSNTNTTPRSWVATVNSAWMDLSATGGTLVAGDSTNITMSINASANSLVAGTYFGTVQFQNTSSGSVASRMVTLVVRVPPQLSVSSGAGLSFSGSVGGPFSPSSQSYTLSNTGSSTLNWTANKTENWVSLSATGGSLAPAASTTVAVSINSNANSLAIGDYSDTIGFTNVTNGIGNTNRAIALTVSPVALRAYYKFDEEAGTLAFDSSGNNNTGTVVGATWTNGMIGAALNFAPPNQVVITNSPSLNPTNSMTVAVWVKPQRWTTNNRILQKGGGDNQYRLLLEATQFQFDLFGVGTVVMTRPSTGVWHHVVGTYDGAVMRFYMDGQQMAQQSATGLVAKTTDNLTIGNKPGSTGTGDHFNGIIDDVRIHSVALTSNQIVQLYQTDSVGDGIPNWWRQKYFGSGSTTNSLSCMTCDADGTGQNNLFKYVAGLDPTNSTSIFVLQISPVAGQAGQQNLLFNPVVNGRSYLPQFTTDLVNPAWSPLTGYAGPVTNGNQVTITDLDATQSNKFYRINLSLP